jgi:hypothetical protein
LDATQLDETWPLAYQDCRASAWQNHKIGVQRGFRPHAAALGHVPKELTDFFDQNMRQLFESKLFRPDSFDWDALSGLDFADAGLSVRQLGQRDEAAPRPDKAIATRWRSAALTCRQPLSGENIIKRFVALLGFYA